MAEYKVAEIFTSINGEGMYAGRLAVFVRFCGCNLRCSYCDTMWANEECEYRLMSEEDIVDEVIRSGVKNVTLTGGEPLLQKDVDIVINKLLAEKDLTVEIETNGSVDISRFIDGEKRPVFTLDYKLESSGMEQYMNTDNYRYLCDRDTVKFVVSNEKDLYKTYDICKKYSLGEKCNIIISPVFGRINPDDIVQFMKDRLFNEARLGLQIHKIIWDPDKRGV